jgi:alginate O-acetyltransferase complex protein AlgI
MKRLDHYALYILLFPQLIAGPIIRFHEIADQISAKAHPFIPDKVFRGFFRFVIGLAKKVLIANVLGEYADRVFDAQAGSIQTTEAWLGMICYTFQIYFDFSGYSDMAIGLAAMMGFTFPENFRNPYISASITEFWQRWHISLSRWMRDYLYIPLGGNRVSPLRVYMNLWIVFLVSGFWHGAEWTFIAWGVYHGTFLVLERATGQAYLLWLPRVLRVVFTFFIAAIGWVFFRAHDVHTAFVFLQRLISPLDWGLVNLPSQKVFFVLVVAVIICMLPVIPGIEKREEDIYLRPAPGLRSVCMASASVVLLFLCITDLMGSTFNPFIYFRF